MMEDEEWDADTIPASWLADHSDCWQRDLIYHFMKISQNLTIYTGYVTVFVLMHIIHFLLNCLGDKWNIVLLRDYKFFFQLKSIDFFYYSIDAEEFSYFNDMHQTTIGCLSWKKKSFQL